MKINPKLLQINLVSGWSFNTTYISGSAGYTNIYKDQTTCFVNLNFKINSVVADKNTTLVNNLPAPLQRQTFIGMVETTPIRLYIDEQGNLKTDTDNIPTGWTNINVTYPLK